MRAKAKIKLILQIIAIMVRSLIKVQGLIGMTMVRDGMMRVLGDGMVLIILQNTLVR